MRLRPVDIRAEIGSITAALGRPWRARARSARSTPGRIGLVGAHSAGDGAGSCRHGGRRRWRTGAGGPEGRGRDGHVRGSRSPTSELKAIDAPRMMISGTLDDVTPDQERRPSGRGSGSGPMPVYRVDRRAARHQSYSDVVLRTSRSSRPARRCRPTVGWRRSATRTRRRWPAREFLPIDGPPARRLSTSTAIGVPRPVVKGCRRCRRPSRRSADPKVGTVTPRARTDVHYGAGCLRNGERP